MDGREERRKRVSFSLLGSLWSKRIWPFLLTFKVARLSNTSKVALPFFQLCLSMEVPIRIQTLSDD